MGGEKALLNKCGENVQEMPVRSLGGEDSLDKEMATHSSIPAEKSLGQRSLVGYSPWTGKESDTSD